MDNLRDKIANAAFEVINPNSAMIWEDACQYERAADAILALPEIADLQKKLAEVEADRDNWRKATFDSLNMKDTADERAEAAEAVVEQLTNDPAYVAVYRAGFDDGKAKLAEAEANINIKADWIEATINDMSANEEATQAAIHRAYQMGLDAALKEPKPINWRDDPDAIVEDDEPQIGRDYE